MTKKCFANQERNNPQMVMELLEEQANMAGMNEPDGQVNDE